MMHNACYQKLLFLLLTRSLHVNSYTVGKDAAHYLIMVATVGCVVQYISL